MLSKTACALHLLAAYNIFVLQLYFGPAGRTNMPGRNMSDA
jgi:hypothetical protein